MTIKHLFFATLYNGAYSYLEWVANNYWRKRVDGENRGQRFDCQPEAQDREINPVHPNYTTFSRSLLDPGDNRKGPNLQDLPCTPRRAAEDPRQQSSVNSRTRQGH